MFTNKFTKLFLLLTLVFALTVTSCANQAEEATMVVDEPAPAEVAAPVEAEMPAETFDLVAAVNDSMSVLPEGFLAVGKVDAFKEILDTGEATLIDVREVGEYEAGHIPGAVNIPLRTLAQNLDKIPQDKPVVTYCKSGYRATLAASSLYMLGYDNVRTFSPSYLGWTEVGEPVTTDMVEATSYGAPDIQPELVAAVDDFLSTIPEGFLSLGTVEKVKEAIDNDAFLIDVREVGEYAEGHIPDAINIPLRTLAQNVEQIPTDRTVVVYCKSGYRAAMATATLQTLGFSNVRAFSPSYNGWVEAGEPIAAVAQ